VEDGCTSADRHKGEQARRRSRERRKGARTRGDRGQAASPQRISDEDFESLSLLSALAMILVRHTNEKNVYSAENGAREETIADCDRVQREEVIRRIASAASDCANGRRVGSDDERFSVNITRQDSQYDEGSRQAGIEYETILKRRIVTRNVPKVATSGSETRSRRSRCMRKAKSREHGPCETLESLRRPSNSVLLVRQRRPMPRLW
jgi:hypothetical protein